jgi:hypothetical protein
MGLGHDDRPSLAFRQEDDDMTSRLTMQRLSFHRLFPAHLPPLLTFAAQLGRHSIIPISDGSHLGRRPAVRPEATASFAQTIFCITGFPLPPQLCSVLSRRCPVGHLDNVTTRFPPTCLDPPAESMRAIFRRAIPFARRARRLKALVLI